MRGRFDITGRVRAGGKNALAVRIIKNATPGSVREKNWQSPDTNGGALGLDNPTYHASVGWDWIPTIRGRNTGIWSSVYLTTTGAVTIEISAAPSSSGYPWRRPINSPIFWALARVSRISPAPASIRKTRAKTI